MLTKSITYSDYNGVIRSEDFLFNLNKAEILEMEMSVNGGMSEYLQGIIKSKNTSELFKIFKELIIKSYGQKSNDGKTFRKMNEYGNPLYHDFISSEAYSVLLMELASDSDKAAEFINGIMPSDVIKEIAAQQNDNIQVATLKGPTT